MTLFEQILWGSIYLAACLLIQIGLLAWGVQLVSQLMPRLRKRSVSVQTVAMMLVMLAVIVFSHTIQVWIWAGAWVLNGILEDWNTAIYFSMVTYTTLGYGDIVLGPGVRIFGTFASITGLLGFGLSTAFLISLITRQFQKLT